MGRKRYEEQTRKIGETFEQLVMLYRRDVIEDKTAAQTPSEEDSASEEGEHERPPTMGTAGARRSWR